MGAETIGYVVGSGGVIGVITAIWNKIILPKLRVRSKRNSEVYLMVNNIHKELKFNDGGSIKDAIWDLKKGQDGIFTRLDNIDQTQLVSMNISGVAHWRSNEKGECTYASPTLCKLMGRSESDILINNWVGCLIPEDKERVFSAWKFSVENKTTFDEIYTVKKSDGKLQRVHGLAFHTSVNTQHTGTIGRLSLEDSILI